MSRSEPALHVRFSQVVSLAVRLLRQQRGLSAQVCANACGLSLSTYSRVETGVIEITVQHLWLLTPVLAVKGKEVWRGAEQWMAKLAAAGWVEDRHAPRVDVGALTQALIKAGVVDLQLCADFALADSAQAE